MLEKRPVQRSTYLPLGVNAEEEGLVYFLEYIHRNLCEND